MGFSETRLIEKSQGLHHTNEELYEACASVAKEMGIEDFRKEMLLM